LTTATYKAVSVAPGTYYWFVRAKDAAGNWSDWSAPFTFRLLSPKPAVPQLTAPAVNLFTNNLTPELTWKPAAYTVSYHVQVATTAKFDTLTQEKSDLTATSLKLDSLSEGKYYWRVRGLNMDGVYGNWSAVRNFTVDITAPATPTLKAPFNSASPLGTPVFSWYASTTATRYQFQYNASTDTGSDNPASVTYRSSEIAPTSFKPSAMSMTTYYWSVRARDAAGNWSSWSAPFAITVQPLKPVAPALIAPVKGNKTSLVTPELTWSNVAYGANYQVQVSTNSTFITTVQNTDGVSDIHLVTDTLSAGTYYWRVRAQNENGVYGPWSAVRTFVIVSNP
jgi:large repetitive protein